MFFRGYVLTKDKRCIEKFKDVLKLKTYEEVQNLPEFAGIISNDSVLVDVDNSEQAEILMNIVEALNLNCRVVKTTRGKHFFFKNRNFGIMKCGTHLTLACGVEADVKIGPNSYAVCKYNGKERFVEWELEEGEEPCEIPKWLYPVKTSLKFTEMDEGSGRNQALYAYILTLQRAGFTKDEIRECIRIANEYVLKTPLPDNELETILRDDSFKKKMYFKGQTFLFREFADDLNRDLHIHRINNQLHIYRDGIYISGYRELEAEMVRVIPDLKQANRKEVLALLEVLNTENFEAVNANMIAFRNGLLNIQTNQFYPFSPEHIITNRIEWDYNPNAYSELLDKTLNKIACFDADIRAILEEAAGYCLFRKNELGKAFILTGTGSNGKSTYLDLLKFMLGKANYSSLDLKNLADRFSTIMLFGKLANIGDDISDEFIADTSIFKKIVTGESIGAEQKGQPKFEFDPYVKLFFSANSIPRMGKGRDWEAIKRRLTIIPFNAKFSPSDPDFVPFIGDELQTQESVEYLIRLGIEGLKRVLTQRHFTESSKVEKEIQDYEESNNPILAFVRECEEESYSIENNPTQDVYERYVGFCMNGGLKEISKIEFGRLLCKHFGLKVSVKRIGKKTIKVFEKKG